MRYQAALRPDDLTLGFPPKQSQDVLQLASDVRDQLVAFGSFAGAAARKLFAGAGDRISALVQEFFDTEDVFDILLPIDAVAGLGFLWREVGELGLPEPQDVGLDADDFADFADAEEKFVGNLRYWHLSS